MTDKQIKKIQDDLVKERKAKRLLEIELNKQKAEFNAIFKNLADAYLMIDLFGNVLKMNCRAKEMFGYDNEKEKFNLMQIAVPDEYDKITTSFQQLLREGNLTNFLLYIKTKDNTYKYMQLNASIIYDENKKPIVAQGIVRDITLSQQYEKSLQVQKSKYEKIINGTNLGLIETDHKGRILTVNQKLTRMYAVSEAEITGKKIEDLFPNPNIRRLLEKIESTAKSEKSKSFEFTINTIDQGKRHWLISVTPNYDINGKVSGYIGAHLDISELKRLQLQKDRLLKKLAKRNDELQDYAQMVSHDLKAPLRNVDTLTAWLKQDYKDKKLDKNGIKTLNTIRANIEKMEKLIEGILVYSTLEEDEVEMYDIDLNKLIGEICTMLCLPENTTVKIVDKLPTVKGDKYRFLQLFQNLIHNAIFYNSKPKIIINIRCEDQGKYWKFCIEDNGDGIEEKYLKKIFEVFQKLDNNINSSGIGLSIVKKIVEVYRGVVYAESKLGKGTKIYFTIKKF